jgi:hypothetical protein
MKYDIQRRPSISGRYQRGYRKPIVPGEIKGKINLKAAKRRKVKAMKAAGHLKGDNRPFAWSGN